jgi:hypothetical protein
MPLLIEITAAAQTALQFDPNFVRAVLRSAGAEIAAVARRARVRSLRTLGSAAVTARPVNDPFERGARPGRCGMMTCPGSGEPSVRQIAIIAQPISKPSSPF